MRNLMEKLYDNLDDAKAFALSFTNFAYGYDDMCIVDFEEELCDRCGLRIQKCDYLMLKSQFKKPYALLDTIEFGVNRELRDELILRFDITEEDFRPIKTKKGEIVFYQITPKHVMLPIHKENGWTRYICTKCGSVRYTNQEQENEKGEFYYYISNAALEEMHDLNVTYEKDSCHSPMVIISRRVYDFLIERYPRTHYFPLFLNQK